MNDKCKVCGLPVGVWDCDYGDLRWQETRKCRVCAPVSWLWDEYAVFLVAGSLAGVMMFSIWCKS